MADTNPRPLRRVAIEITVGIAIGFLLGTLFGPRLISMWYEPPSRDAFSCAGSVEKALGQFVMFQLVAAAVGGVVLAVLMVFIRRLFRKNPPAPGTAS